MKNMPDNPKRVAVVCAIDITMKILLIAQIKAAQKAGFKIYGVCSKGENYDWLRQQDITMVPITIKRSISPISDIITLWKMTRFFKHEQISIVHTHTPKCSLLGQLAARLAHVPVIINTVHGFYFHDNMKPLVRQFYILMEKIAGRCSSLILSQNPEDIITAVKLGICPAEKIIQLGNGVDLDKFDPQRFDDSFIRTKKATLDIPPDSLVVCIIGRLVKEKGFIELIAAMQNIMQTRKDVWFLVIGPEEPVKADRISPDIFRQGQIAPRTRWLGNRDDIPELLACSDIYALPSWREGFPRSAIEAAAMGLPIVASNIRGCRQVVEDGVNGFLVPLKDRYCLEAALETLLSSPELRSRMGQASYAKSRSEFDENRVCELVVNAYQQQLTTLLPA